MNNRCARGFTLLEILIALGLTTLILVAVMKLLAYGAEVWYDSDATIRATENDTIAMGFMRKMLENAKPLVWAEGPQGASITFEGREDILYLAAPLPVANAQAMGVYVFAFTVETSAEVDNSALVVKYWPLSETSLAETLAGPEASEVLMTDVSRVRFEYYGYPPDATPEVDIAPQWLSEWTEGTAFPLAVRLTIDRVDDNDSRFDTPVRASWENVVIGLNQAALR